MSIVVHVVGTRFGRNTAFAKEVYSKVDTVQALCVVAQGQGEAAILCSFIPYKSSKSITSHITPIQIKRLLPHIRIHFTSQSSYIAEFHKTKIEP